MIQQINQPITFEAFFTANKQGALGLTITVDVYSPSGALITSGASASETGGGFYRYTYANPSSAGGWRAIFKTTDATVDMQHIPSLWEVGVAGVQNLDLEISNVPYAVWTIDSGDVEGSNGPLDTITGALIPLNNVAPDHKPSVDAQGRVVVAIVADKTGYSLATAPPTTAQIATAILDTPNGAGTGITVRDAIKRALANAVGDMTLGGDVQTFHNPDGTVSVAFSLTPAGGPYTGRVAQS